MNEREEDRPERTPEETAALDALKRSKPPTVPDEVRERARRAFLTGRSGEAGPAPKAPEAGGAEPMRAERPRVPLAFALHENRGGRRRAAAFAIVLAAAAVFLLIRTGLRPEGNWQATDVIASGGIELARGTLMSGDTVLPGANLARGEIHVGDSSELELQLRSKLRIRMLAGTDAGLPDAPGRWFRRDRTLDVRRGEVFGATFGPLGFRFRLRTPEAEAVLTGTSFAVIRNEEATCFCLYRGRLDIALTKGGAAVDLPLEHRVLIYRDGRPPRVEPITDRERMKLSMLEGAESAPASGPSR